MRPFYLKGTEDGKQIFAKVVITKSVATVDILMCSPDSTWTTKKKPYDLTKAEEKREYSIFLERYFNSSFREFDAARKRMQEASKSNPQPEDTGKKSQEWRQEMLKQIRKFRKKRTDENNNE